MSESSTSDTTHGGQRAGAGRLSWAQKNAKQFPNTLITSLSVPGTTSGRPSAFFGTSNSIPPVANFEPRISENSDSTSNPGE